MRGPRSHEILVACAAAFFLAAHAGVARLTLEDIDSINFALGLRDYDVLRHQPHPPGYPVYIAVGRAVSSTLAFLRPGLPSPEASGLSLFAMLAGAVAVVWSHRLLLTAGCTAWSALVGTLLFAVAPLTWLTAARPLSDMPGLAAAIVCQALLLRLIVPSTTVPLARVAWTGLVSGVAVGVRSQVMWLTLPLAAVVVVAHLRGRDWRRGGVLVGALAAGALVWLVPMLVLSGGPEAYLDALDDQAGEDFAGVPMLALQFGPARAWRALVDSFVHPWAVLPLALVVLGGAAVGLARLALRVPATLRLFVLLWGPYAVLHLLFQETETTRYALPLVLPTCAACAVAADGAWTRRGRHVALAAVTMVMVAAGAVSLQASWQYVRAREGVFDAFVAMRAAWSVAPPDVVLLHRQVWAETRRARQLLPVPGVDEARTVPRAREWMELLPWMARPTVTAWWLADPRRGDRVAVDPRAVVHRDTYAWPAPAAALLGGMRPHPFDWLVVTNPSWVLHDGWALTPALAGLSREAGHGPEAPDGARATVRADGVARTLLVGGRHLGAAGAEPLTMRVATDDSWQASTVVAPGAFHRVWTVPAAAGPSQTLVVRAATGADGSRVALEQFDIQPRGVPVLALGAGWHEPERDVVSGRRWRWMGPEASVEIWGAACDVQLTLTGTWPRHYDEAPVLAAQTATGVPLASHALARPFTVRVVVPAHVQVDGRADLVLRTSQSFVAGERTGTGDARRLALEVADITVIPADGGRACANDVDTIAR